MNRSGGELCGGGNENMSCLSPGYAAGPGHPDGRCSRR
jgi:hypothetical protein